MKNKSIQVVHFQRKLGFGQSVERLFADVRSALPSDIVVTVCNNRYYSQGIWQRCYDMLRVVWQQGNVNHVTGHVHYLTYLIQRRRTILTVLDCGALERTTGLRRWLLWLLWFWLPVKRCAVVTVISAATKKELLKHIRCDPAKIEVIHCNVSAEFVPFPFHFNLDCPRILQIGTAYNKNIERVATALKGFKCRLVIIGILSESQKVALQEYGIESENYIGLSREQLLEQYQQADIVLFASLYEGFGLPIVEANAVGRPVITSALYSMPEVAGNAACYVDPYDTDSIRAGVERICQDTGYRQQLIDHGFHNVERFRIGVLAEQYAQLYRRIHAAQGT
jgi:glycosyltransferase involved in cell wall biosynthesis